MIIILDDDFKDERIVPKQKYLDSEDSFGPYLTLNPSRASHFWMPDVFIDQAKALRIPTYYTKPASLRVYNDSTIRYSSRYKVNNIVGVELPTYFYVHVKYTI